MTAITLTTMKTADTVNADNAHHSDGADNSDNSGNFLQSLKNLKPMTISLLKNSLMLVCGALLLAGCSTSPPPGIVPVNHFEIQKYLGRWYEIARLDHSFERGMSNVSATYALQTDGSVSVLNQGYLDADGKWKQALGRALFNGPSDVASLKVSFFGPFYGGYHVIKLDPGYRWALVAGNDSSYLWILARDRQLPAEVVAALLTQARQAGFDTTKLIWVKQDKVIPAAPN